MPCHGPRTGAYLKEYQGFKDRDAVRIVVQPLGAKILGSTTSTEYKTDQGVLQKSKVRLCARGDQQVYEVNDTYSPVLKAPEVRPLTAIAAQHGYNIYKTDTKQAFLYLKIHCAKPPLPGRPSS